MDADWAGVGQGERLDTVEEVEVAWGDFAFAGYWEAGVEGEGVNDIVAGFGRRAWLLKLVEYATATGRGATRTLRRGMKPARVGFTGGG